MTFDLIAPEQLHSVWPAVREGLLRIKDKIKESWLPEDVFTAIRTKRSSLYVVREDDRVLGFFVAEASVEPFTHVPLLYVWCLHGPDGLPYADACIAELDRLAQSINAKRIRFIGRRGWAKVLQGKFEAVRVVYERELSGEMK
jgi:hypothetical protein